MAPARVSWCGLAAVALDLAAVACLHPIPHAYKPGTVPLWLAESVAAPTATALSAWGFTLGLACLGAFAFERLPRSAAALLAAGAILDAMGAMLPIATLHVERPVGEGLLWAALLMDSAFNALLGLALLATAATRSFRKGLRALAFVTGLASLPVALQFASDTYASLLLVSGPLWLAWVAWASVASVTPDQAGSVAS